MQKSYLDQATGVVTSVTNTGKQKTKRVLIIFFSVLAIGIFFWVRSKWSKWFGKPDKVELPNNGSGIPSNWKPNSAVAQIYEAMYGGIFGYGYDGNVILTVLSDKTDDQLAAIYNSYNDKYDRNLMADFEDQLTDASDLSIVQALFKNVDTNSAKSLRGQSSFKNYRGNLLK